jgi:hypothetical protein
MVNSVGARVVKSLNVVKSVPSKYADDPFINLGGPLDGTGDPSKLFPEESYKTESSKSQYPTKFLEVFFGYIACAPLSIHKLLPTSKQSDLLNF